MDHVDFHGSRKSVFCSIKGLLILKKQDNEVSYCNLSELARDEHVKTDHPYACCINFPKKCKYRKNTLTHLIIISIWYYLCMIVKDK